MFNDLSECLKQLETMWSDFHVTHMLEYLTRSVQLETSKLEPQTGLINPSYNYLPFKIVRSIMPWTATDVPQMFPQDPPCGLDTFCAMLCVKGQLHAAHVKIIHPFAMGS